MRGRLHPSRQALFLLHFVIIRPERDEAWIKENWIVEGVISMTQSDIEKGASGYVMLDENLQLTGAPPPDPPGAYCMVCQQRIWSHDGNTAFPVEISSSGDWDNAGAGACCERCSQLADDELLEKIRASHEKGNAS
jgi:hypothetical protein